MFRPYRQGPSHGSSVSGLSHRHADHLRMVFPIERRIYRRDLDAGYARHNGDIDCALRQVRSLNRSGLLFFALRGIALAIRYPALERRMEAS